jgi:RNA polymerase sigma-70 factor, ECF subfamily
MATAVIGFDARKILMGVDPIRPSGGMTVAYRTAEPQVEQEAKLVERCLRGDGAAWETLLRTYSRRAYSLCLRFTGSPTDAQDLTQEVFFRVYRSLGTFRPAEGSFSVWLTRLTRNLLIDHYRRTKSQRVTDSMEEKLTELENRPESRMSADESLRSREAGELLEEALKRLSPELREAVILRDLEQMEYKEIAETLNVPEGTVKSRINRGRTELGRLLRKMKVS